MFKKSITLTLFLTLTLFVFISFFPIQTSANTKTYDDTNSYWFTSDVINQETNYGVSWNHILGTSNNGSQQVNIFEMKTDGESSKLVTWMAKSDNATYRRLSLIDAAKDYELNHPGWIVVAGINADQYYTKYGTNLGTDGSDKYSTQTYYPYGQDYDHIFPVTATGNSATQYVGINNNGQFIDASTIKGTFLSIYDENNTLINKYQISAFNRQAGDDEIIVWSGYMDGGNGIYKAMDVTSSNTLAIVSQATTAHMNNTTAYADYKGTQAIDSFFGKGTITSNDTTTASLGKGAFAIDTNNQEVKNLLTVGSFIKVEMEYENDELNKCESITGFHAIQRLNGADAAVNGSYNTSSYPRSVFGIKEDGTYVLFTSDKGNGYGGLNGWEINACLKQYGVTTAFQDDGGGSVTAIWRNDQGNFDIVNTPRDGGARANLTHLFFVVKVDEYAINYNLNGGYFEYESYEAMQNEFLADFNTYAGKTFTKENFFNSTWSSSRNYALDFFNDENMSAKWNWLLDYFNEARILSSMSSVANDNGVLRGEIHGFLNNIKYENSNAAYTNSSNYADTNITNKWLSFIKTDIKISTTYNNLKGIQELPIPEKENSTFLGWYLDSNYTTKIEHINAGTTGDITLYARWINNSDIKYCSVTYNLDGGTLNWETTTINAEKGVGIDTVSDLPEYFATDFYNYLTDNDLINSSTVNNEFKAYANCFESFSKQYDNGTIKSLYNQTKNNAKNFVDGYSQFYFNSISNDGAKGGFFGTEPYKSKYQTLFTHVVQMTDIRYPDVTDIAKYKTVFGFALDYYFFGSVGLLDEKTENYEIYNYLRSVLCTPSVQYNGLEKVDIVYTTDEFLSVDPFILPTPFKTGYKFMGWYTEPEFINQITSVTSDSIVYAKYESLASTVYTVEYIDGNGDVVSSQIVKEGLNAYAPFTARKNKDAEYTYTFSGWDHDGKNITSDLTINATFKAKKNTYDITFIVDEEIVSKTEYEYGETITPPSDPILEGYIFTGWDTDFSTVTGDLTIIATFKVKPIEYTVSFYVNYELYYEQIVEQGESVTPPTDPVLEGYVFNGWDTDFSTVTEDLTIHAIFLKKSNKSGCNKGAFIEISLLLAAIYIFRRKTLIK